MSLTYVIADLHGRFDLLQMALERIDAHRQSVLDKTVIFTGDYVDRGPQSRQIIERLMAGPVDPATRWVCLKGNHEDMMVVSIDTGLDLRWWLGNGGGATLMSYGLKQGDVADTGVVPKTHLDWLRALPLYHEDPHRVYVHAGVSSALPLDAHESDFILWTLYADDDPGGYRGKHVVHGHHQHAHGPLCLAGRTDLDTFAWYTGRIVVGVFDDTKAGGPSDLIEVKGKPFQARAA